MDKPAPAPSRPPRAVVLGGGTGAPQSIRALLAAGAEVAAVVAMADDGGSSGLLREHAGSLPPGDIRKCLASMAADPDSPWARAFVSRLHYDHDHPLGNLMLATLSEVTGSLPLAIELCSRLLGARGQVFPSTLASVGLVGWDVDGRRLTGQAMLTRSGRALAAVALEPAAPEAYPPAVSALSQADLIVLGPGSLFTSIIPNLLVPGIREAVVASPAVKLFVCSLADMQGETRGMDACQHVQALLQAGLAGSLDLVLVHQGDPSDGPPRFPAVALGPEQAEAIRRLGPGLMLADLADPLRPTWHEVGRLAGQFASVLAAGPAARREAGR